MRVALYARVSTREQAQEGYSISAQLNSLKAYAQSQNWHIVGIYTDDGLSAKDTDRQQLQRMINDIKEDKIDVVLVYRLDRLTRSVLDLYELLATFDEYSCGFKSATEVYDTTTAMGRLFITIVAALAQWERENLAERVSMGMQEKFRQGEYPGGRAPYGYKVENSKLIINEDEAKVIKLIYEKYINGYGMNRIAQYLNRKNIKTRTGHSWYRTSIKTILESEAVKGNLIRNGEVYKNTHEPIIDEVTGNEVRRIIKDRTSRIRTSSVSSNFLFSGIIQCCHCGSNLHGSSTKRNGKTHYTYRCPKKRQGECDGENTTVSERPLEKQFIEKLSKIDVSDVVDDIDIEINNHTSKQDLEKELHEIEERKKKWQFAWVNEMISNEDLKKRMKEENEREKEVKKQLNEITDENIEVDEEIIKEMLKDIKLNWDNLKRKEKKLLIQSLVKNIGYKKDGRKAILTSVEFNV
mgnify:CR=1 FL=1